MILSTIENAVKLNENAVKLNLSTIDIGVILFYLTGIAAMGLYFGRKTESTEEYFVGGRSFKGWVIGLSLVGTSISSVSFLAFPGDAYKTAYLRLVPNIMLPVALIFAAYVFLPFYRKNKITSAYEYLEMRFGPGIRVYGSLAFVGVQLMRISSILFLVALLIETVTKLPPVYCIILGGIFVSFYTIVGGIKAVIWTDVIQTIVLALGAILCLLIVFSKLPGGISEVFEVASAADKFSFSEMKDGIVQPVKWGFTLQSKTATMMIFLGLNMWLLDYGCNQHSIQRYAASKTMKDARSALVFAAFCSVPIWLFFMFLGTSLYVFYQAFPSPEAAAMLSGESKAEGILPYFIMSEMPVGAIGVILAAALAAAMSSLDSSINAISTVGVVDIYRRHLVKGKGDKHYLLVARLIAIVTGIVMVLGAIWFSMADQKTLQDTTTALTSILSGGLLGLFLLGMLTTRGDGKAAACGIFFTLMFTGWLIATKKAFIIGFLSESYAEKYSDFLGDLPAWLNKPFEAYYAGIIGNLVMFAVGYIIGLLLFSSKKDLTNLTIWTHEDSPEDINN
jgi:solute:Na+ symporter, SSS family